MYKSIVVLNLILYSLIELYGACGKIYPIKKKFNATFKIFFLPLQQILKFKGGHMFLQPQM